MVTPNLLSVNSGGGNPATGREMSERRHKLFEMIRLPPMPGHLSCSRSWSCVGAFEPRALRGPKSNACARGKPRAVGQSHSGTGWAGEDPRSHWKQILPETVSQD